MDISHGKGVKIMTKAYVLLTAMPPTTGHLQLIQFANRLSDSTVVILCTQPHEPFPRERATALRQAIRRTGVASTTQLIHFKKAIEQDPRAPGFWEMWKSMMTTFGMTSDDIIVASERYGKKLASTVGARFFPYDIARDLNPAKATPIRNEPLKHFDEILPEFKPYLTTRVTVFGAESTGKTTLSRALAKKMHGQWLFEYARPYLEETTNEITVDSMNAIWHGQKGLQDQALNITSRPLIVQDTDLFSTVGYWQFPHWQPSIGTCPAALVDDARTRISDLYIVTKSNIPFEEDPLRYGGNAREGSDDYWIALCERYHLPYVVLDSSDHETRLDDACAAVLKVMSKKGAALSYDRHGL
jgi:NadR type nicotinamide-nucleotide adenylyltransferase